LYQAVGILYSLFHLDIDNLTLSLLNITLPNLLHQCFPSPATVVGSQRVQSLSSGRFLNEPRGGALAKLCVLAINLMCTARQFTISAGWIKRLNFIFNISFKPTSTKPQAEKLD